MGLVIIAVIVLILVGMVILARRSAGRMAVPGSGTVISQIKPLEGFSRVNVGNAFQVELSEAPRHSVTLTADDNVIDLVEVQKEGDTLRIGLETGDYHEVTLKARIGMPELRGVMLSGASTGSVEGFSSGNDLSIGLSGASILEGRVEARQVDMRLSGASKIVISGSADKIMARGSGASVLQLEEFVVDRASVDLSGASRATVDVKILMEHVDLSGASMLYYAGDPQLEDVETSGASRLERR